MRLLSLVLFGLVGVAACGGAHNVPTGAACSSDGDCVTGQCLATGIFDVNSHACTPARKLCTKACQTGSDCWSLDVNDACVEACDGTFACLHP